MRLRLRRGRSVARGGAAAVLCDCARLCHRQLCLRRAAGSCRRHHVVGSSAQLAPLGCSAMVIGSAACRAAPANSNRASDLELRERAAALQRADVNKSQFLAVCRTSCAIRSRRCVSGLAAAAEDEARRRAADKTLGHDGTPDHAAHAPDRRLAGREPHRSRQARVAQSSRNRG